MGSLTACQIRQLARRWARSAQNLMNSCMNCDTLPISPYTVDSGAKDSSKARCACTRAISGQPGALW